MRLRCRLATGLTAAAAALVPAAAVAAANPPPWGGVQQADRLRPAELPERARDHGPARPAGHAGPAGRDAACSALAPADFPVAARVRKGPDVYEAGGGHGRWSLRLVNTAARPCDRVHPVVVLVDRKGRLRPGQVRLGFRAEGRWHPVDFEDGGRGETVGVLGDGTGGFTVRPGGAVTVPVRLAFTSDTTPDRVVASAAVVQRRGDDGDWVGESDDYPFDIAGYGGSAWPYPGELAQTGPRFLRGLGVTAGALLLAGGALVAGARRLRARGR
ncbi:hypothetical protein [Streptomyces sp. CC224B]|uniref:hypothetical protein n=1 Tax=Streptomyces sp. CC224B TaxID=3044571 RepID=UPI0024A845C7|nr:hypothetical protein [Streptomyces sp. CC224B]